MTRNAHSRRALIVAGTAVALLAVTIPAVQDLRRMGRIDALAARLRSSDYDTKDAAQNELGRLTNERDIERLVAHFDDDWELLRKQEVIEIDHFTEELQVVFALIGEPSVKPLITLLQSNCKRPRSYESRALPAFVNKMLRSRLEREGWRRHAIVRRARAGLVGIDGPAVEALMSMLQSNDTDVRYAAMNTLALMRDASLAGAMVRLTESADSRISRDAWDCLVLNAHEWRGADMRSIGRDETGILARAAARGAADEPRNRWTAVDMLCAVDSSDALAALEGLLESTDSDTRLMGIYGLSLAGDSHAVLMAIEEARRCLAKGKPMPFFPTSDDPRMVDVLMDMMRGSEPHLWYWAAIALGRLDRDAAADSEVRRRAAGAIKEALADESAERRRRATDGFSIGGAPSLVAAIQEGLKSEDPAERGRIVSLLRPVQSADSVSALLSVVNDPDRGVRAEALAAVGVTEDPRADAALRKALGDKEPMVRDIVETVLWSRKYKALRRSRGR